MIDETLLPNLESRFAQSAAIHRMLVEAGHAAIGFDHFAKPEDSLAVAGRERRLRRNFQGFTDERCDVVIGLGTSAISLFPEVLVQNDKNVGTYRDRIEAGGLAGARGVRRDADMRLRWSLIERLLCDEEIDVADAEGVTDRWRQAISYLSQRGVCEITGGRLRITPIGRPYARLVASAFDATHSLESGRVGSERPTRLA